jgi:hypothetical protein
MHDSVAYCYFALRRLLAKVAYVSGRLYGQCSIVCGQVRADGVCKGCFTIRCSEFYLITKQSLLCIKRVQVLVFHLYPVCVGSCSGID